MRTRVLSPTDSRTCPAAAMMRLAVLRRTPGIRRSASSPVVRTWPTVSRPASMRGANVTFPRMRSRSRSTGSASSRAATTRSRTASYARRATSRDSSGAARTASMASWTARPSWTTARAAFPGPRHWASGGLPSAFAGSGSLASSAARATVVRASVLELVIGLMVTIEDIADTPGIYPNAGRERGARGHEVRPRRQPRPSRGMTSVAICSMCSGTSCSGVNRIRSAPADAAVATAATMSETVPATAASSMDGTRCP